jgi:carbamoyl-phosphate synthase large subunit
MTSRSLLITCAGRWAGVVTRLQQAVRSRPDLGIHRVLAASSDELTPAGVFADGCHRLPLLRDPGYVEALIGLCHRESVAAVLPVIDLDVRRLAPELGRLQAAGLEAMCPEQDVAALCADKWRVAELAQTRGWPHPRTVLDPREAPFGFPAFMKPRSGFGSVGARVCGSPGEALERAAAEPGLMLQELIDAPELTVDGYVARSGHPVVCVPRRREKIVSGESYRTTTIEAPAAHALSMDVMREFGRRGFHGPLNIQWFETDPPLFVEVNPRLGSGSVLADVATAGRLFECLLIEATGGTATGDPHAYERGVTLSRYLGDVFHRGATVVRIDPPGQTS